MFELVSGTYKSDIERVVVDKYKLMAESIVYVYMVISIFVSQQQIEAVVGEWKGRGHSDAYSFDCCQCVYINIATTRKVSSL